MNPLYYRKILIHKFARPYMENDDVQRVIEKLSNYDYHGADLDLKTLTNFRIYSAKINTADRLLITFEGDALIILECVFNHDYQKAKFLKPLVLRNRLREGVLDADCRVINEDSFVTLQSVASELPDTPQVILQHSYTDFINQTFLELDLGQMDAIETRLPALINGAAGTGKSVVGYVKMENLYQTLVETEGDESVAPQEILYLVKSKPLRDSAQQYWRESPSYQEDAKVKIVFKTHDEFLADLNIINAGERDMPSQIQITGFRD
jgi:hypothetical protein